MKGSIIIYYGIEKNGDIKAMIDELLGIKNSPYFRRRSRSEIARLVLAPALKEEIKRYKIVKKNEFVKRVFSFTSD